MTITDIRLRVIENENVRPITNSLGRTLCVTRQITVIEVMTDEGVTGVLGTVMLGDVARHVITHHLRHMLKGQDPLNYERLNEMMYGKEAQHWRPPFPAGEAIHAMSALDTCIWDIIGKATNKPLYQLLGGFRDKVPGYASGGHYVTLGDQAEELRYLEWEMTRYMHMGFRQVKMRVGRNLQHDCERAKLVRQIIGPDTKLMIDFNSSPSYHGGVPAALRFIRRLEPYDPFWFEDPLVLDDVVGLKQVSDATDAAIATGEYHQSLFAFRDLIVNKAVDILLPDATAVCGGITQWRKIAAMAEAFRVPIAAHIGDAAHVHCVAAVPNGLTVEVFTPHDEAGRAYEVDPIMLPNADGLLELPAKPGLGVELNEEYIRRHQVA